MGIFRVSLVFGVVRILAVSVLLEASLIDRFVKGHIFLKWKRFPYNSKSLPIIAIVDTTKESSDTDKTQDAVITEEDPPYLLRMTRRTKILSRSECIGLVPIDATELAQIRPLPQ